MQRLLPLILLTGCFSFGSNQRANTLGAGHHEVAIEAAGVTAATSTEDLLIIPRASLRYRAGLTERFDLGARLGVTGLDALLKYQLTEPTDEDFVAALTGEIGGFVLGEEPIVLRSQVAGLFGWGFGAHQVVLGPRAYVWYLKNDTGFFSGNGGFVATGLSAGADFALTEALHLGPELTAAMPILVLGGEGDLEDAFVLLELGLALAWIF